MNFSEWTRKERWHCCWEKECRAYKQSDRGCGRMHIVLVGWMVAEKEAVGWLLLDIGPPLSYHLSPSLNSLTSI